MKPRANYPLLCLLFLTMASVLFFASRTHAAGEALTPVVLTVSATMESIGINVVYNGDTNSNATMTPQYRVSSSDPWMAGQPCVRTIALNARCSLFFLTPSTTYQLQVIFTDPDGALPTVLSNSTTTRATAPTETITQTFYVSTTGSNSNNGTSPATAFQTIQYAVNRASAGTKIIVVPGVYREAVTVSASGTSTHPIILESQETATTPGANPAVIDNSYPGLDVVDGTDNWLPDPGNPGGYYTDLTSYTPSDQVIGVYRDTERIYAYSYYPYNSTSNYANYLNGIYCVDGTVNCIATNVVGGYFYDRPTKRLYIELPDQTDPDLVAMHVLRRNAVGLRLQDASNVIVRGFRVQYVNSGIVVRAGASAIANLNWVEKVRTQFAKGGITVGEQYGTGNRVHGTVVQDSVIVDTNEQTTWPWAAVKQNDVESTGIILAGGTGTILQRNTIRDVFNGVDGTITWALTDTTYNTDTDVVDNTVTDSGDDGIELDGAATNLRVMRNTVASTRGGTSGQATLSAAPISVGPAWIIRNVLADPRQYSMKSSFNAVTSAGRLFAYHNTFYGSHGDLFGLLRYTQSNNQTGFTAVFRNNLVVASGTQTTPSGIGSLFGDAATDHVTPPVTFDADYNGYFSNRTCTGSCRLFNWLNVDYPNLGAFAAASGQEAHGRWANPAFVDAERGNFALQNGSGAIDQGVVLTGINDSFSGFAPDFGAFEFTADVTPPAAVNDLQAR